MKQMEETVRAIRDWTKSILQNNLKEFKEELNLNTLLRKTGDASKVTTSFSTYGSRTLPSSGEKLDITIGKIKKYLSDLGSAAYSNVTPTRDYDNITYKVIKRHTIWNDLGDTAAVSKTITLKKENSYLLYGIGGAYSASTKVKSTCDFGRIYWLWNNGSANDTGATAWKLVQLGSVGSTARFTVKDDGIDYTMGTSGGKEALDVILGIPKGSHATVAVLELIMTSGYVNGSGT